VASTRASRRVTANTYTVLPDGRVIAPRNEQNVFNWDATDEYGNRLFYNTAPVGSPPVWVAAGAHCSNEANIESPACKKWFDDYSPAGAKTASDDITKTAESIYIPPNKEDMYIPPNKEDMLPMEQFSDGKELSPY
jgi:hypothetical protein